jgi:NitT/TauT family transport system ATP-binding protein
VPAALITGSFPSGNIGEPACFGSIWLRTITAFENIAFSLYRGEIVVVLGPSGCGKSSFLKTVAGLETAAGGSIRALNHTITAPISQFGFVFQQPVLFPWLNVRQNVGFALALKSGPKLHKERRNQAIDQALSDVGLTQASHARPRQLSGGMAQRVALARALVREPDLLLLDEPFSALDAITRLEMQKLLLKVVETRGISTLLVTHDIDEALLLADRIVLMSRNPGRFVQTWQVSKVKPRFDRATELTQLRLSILAALSQVIDRPNESADPSVLRQVEPINLSPSNRDQSQ